MLGAFGIDLSKVDVAKIMRLLGVDLSQIDLRELKQQCRASQLHRVLRCLSPNIWFDVGPVMLTRAQGLTFNSGFVAGGVLRVVMATSISGRSRCSRLPVMLLWRLRYE